MPADIYQHSGEAGVSLLNSLVMGVSQLSCGFRLWLQDNIKLTDSIDAICASISAFTHFLLFWHYATISISKLKKTRDWAHQNPINCGLNLQKHYLTINRFQSWRVAGSFLNSELNPLRISGMNLPDWDVQLMLFQTKKSFKYLSIYEECVWNSTLIRWNWTNPVRRRTWGRFWMDR